MGFTFNKVQGTEGSVTIPSLGAVIGTMQSWSLHRRGDIGPKEGLYDLRAVFSYLNPHLFNDPDYAQRRQILVTIARGKQYRLVLGEDSKVTLDGRSLLIERVGLDVPE